MKHVYICEAITTIKIAYLSFPKLSLVPFWSLSPPISLRGPWNYFLFLEMSLHFLGFYVSGIICCAVCVRGGVFFTWFGYFEMVARIVCVYYRVAVCCMALHRSSLILLLTVGLFTVWGYYKWGCYKHWGTILFTNAFIFSGQILSCEIPGLYVSLCLTL